MLEVRLVKALPGFRLDVAFSAGQELVTLFGPSGAGKSLTLRCIAGVLRPDAGRVAAGGQVLLDTAAGIDVPPQRRRVGYVPQRFALFPHLTAAENVAYGVREGDARARRALVRELLEEVGLAGLEDRRPRELSVGQQQRVALARAVAIRPRVLLLDEPFSALDGGLRASLRETVAAVHRRWGLTTVLVTHDLAEAFTLGTRMVLVDGGRVLQEGSREEAFYRPRTRRAAELLGVRNVLPATVLGHEGPWTRLDWEGRTVLAERRDGLAPGARAWLCVRATQVMIVRPDREEDGAERPNVVRGRLVEEVPHGDTLTLRFRAEGSPRPADLEIEIPGYAYHRLGLDRRKEVSVSLRPGDLHVVGEEEPAGSGAEGGEGAAEPGGRGPERA
ncbi:MAG TPA: ABC transporter ATP-binding protein [Dehalococcoidia bacterium]